ncbi:hypothetical protein [Caballeronia sp. CLC5]|uniref:hypothetical protein n=1 Tax=Caballeronia sp. CLC5 TaxID=2906764 RepID=UPI001F27AAC5|nr:hypothetical protein [Caballeronia sp. CLC5]MCE4574847.1 hypothetical protein [Caballeronia sp. CLC5]
MKAIELIEREMLGDLDLEKASEIQAHLEEFGRAAQTPVVSLVIRMTKACSYS